LKDGIDIGSFLLSSLTIDNQIISEKKRMNARAIRTKSNTLNVMIAGMVLQANRKLIDGNNKKVGRERTTLSNTTSGLFGWY